MPSSHTGLLKTSGVLGLRAVVGAYLLFSGILFTRPDYSTNIWSRMAPAFALVDHGTLAIDQILEDRPTEDVSYSGGRTYSNKAPGLLSVSVPAYALARAVMGESFGARVVATWVTQVMGTAVPTVVFLLMLHGLLVRRYGLEPARATLLVWIAAFGTLTLPYSVALFGHQTAAALVGIAMVLTLRDEDRLGSVRPGVAFLAALALGGATATDYLAAIPAVGWTGWFVYRHHRSDRALGAWLAGASVAAAALGTYHWICFGAPWRFPYATGVLSTEFAELVAWHSPHPVLLFELLIGSRRGLLYANPVWLAVLPGVVAAFRRGGPPEWRFGTLIVLSVLLLLASWNSWHGGWAVGPRYAVASLPLGVPLLVPAARRWPVGTGILGTVSAAIMMLVSVTSPIVPLDRADPVFNWAIPQLLAHGGTTFTIFGVRATASLASIVLVAAAFLSLAPSVLQLRSATPRGQDAPPSP